MPSGGGIAATKRPKPSAGSAQISTAIEAPCPAATRSRPGLRRLRVEREQPVVRRGLRGFEKARAKGFQLAVERHAGQMRADDREGDLAGLRRGGQRRKRRLRLAGRAHRQSGVGVKHAAERGEQRVAAAGRQQRDAERRAVRPHARRQREAGEVEQVDEIGVGAEPAVELDRIGQHLLDRVDGRHGRHQQHVDLAEDVIAHAAQVFELVERREGIHGARRARRP